MLMLKIAYLLVLDILARAALSIARVSKTVGAKALSRVDGGALEILERIRASGRLPSLSPPPTKRRRKSKNSDAPVSTSTGTTDLETVLQAPVASSSIDPSEPELPMRLRAVARAL